MPVARINITGPAAAFVTTTVVKWTPIFKSDKAATEVVVQLKETANLFNVAILGYVIMPSHVHLLLGFRDITILSKFMQAFKSLISRRIKKLDLGKFKNVLYQKDKFNLWMRRFDDLIIYSEKQFKTKLEYIHDNQVKDGFAVESINWKYSSAGDWLLDERGFIEIEKDYRWLNLEEDEV